MENKMKKIIISLMMFLLITGCDKDTNNPTSPIDPRLPPQVLISSFQERNCSQFDQSKSYCFITMTLRFSTDYISVAKLKIDLTIENVFLYAQCNDDCIVLEENPSTFIKFGGFIPGSYEVFAFVVLINNNDVNKLGRTDTYIFQPL